jgi:hypothetical protein
MSGFVNKAVILNMTYGLHLGDDVSAMFLTAYDSADAKTLDYWMLQFAES